VYEPRRDEPPVTHDQDQFRRRAIRATLTVVGIAAVIGLVVGGLTAGAVYLTGLVPAEQDTSAASPPDPGQDNENELPTPSLLPTKSPTPEASAGPSQGATPEATTKPTKKRKPKPAHPIRLLASSNSVATMERVTLSGRYPGGNGTSLQVQRREGGAWVPFPTSATVDGGAFTTYVASGQSGPNAFRVIDPSTGRRSNVVVVRVS
jgi:hypothetical protein